MRRTALTGALFVGLMAPAAASAAPASFAGTCDFTGSANLAEGFGRALGSVSVNGSQGQCSGRLVRADGVALNGTHRATFTGSRVEPWTSCETSAAVGPDPTNASKATLKLLDVYPAPAGTDPPDELIRTAVPATAHVRGSAFRWLLQGATNASYPAGTFASFDATYTHVACGSQPLTGRLTTGTSPSSGAPTDVLIDAG